MFFDFVGLQSSCNTWRSLFRSFCASPSHSREKQAHHHGLFSQFSSMSVRVRKNKVTAVGRWKSRSLCYCMHIVIPVAAAYPKHTTVIVPIYGFT